LKYTGKIIVLAYPDTFVTMSKEFICKLLPLVGIGTQEYMKAGHAALILIENETGIAQYFDFGRYVTPEGLGRVRGDNTDADVSIPFKAMISKKGQLKNLEQFLLWLDANPVKTHGEGRLLASLCDTIDYSSAKNYIDQLQNRGSIPYGAFDKAGSNCARFVTDTLIAGAQDKKVIKGLKFNKKFTPSTIGNVEKASTSRVIYEVFKGVIKPYKGSILKENLTNYFDKNRPEYSNKKHLAVLPKNAQKLTGIGSSAWFSLSIEEQLPFNYYRIKRFNESHELDFDGVFFSNEFNLNKPYVFVYDSHCKYCHMIQGNRKIKLTVISSYQKFNALK